MPLQTPLTELQAVNVMLQAIGEAPVNTLAAGSTMDVSMALTTLTECSHRLQEIGWQFNTESDYPLVPDINGLITLAGNIVRVDQDSNTDSGDYDLVQRGTSLYDRKHRTAVFTQTVKAEVVLLLPFDQLPPIARRYITVKAARVFQARVVGSETLNGFTERDEMECRTAFEEAEGENADYSIFDNYDVARSVDRNRG
jgi:hypothetical protein